MVRPDPFPNSEVKTVCADDTPAHAGGKVGSCPYMIELWIKPEFFRARTSIDKTYIIRHNIKS